MRRAGSGGGGTGADQQQAGSQDAAPAHVESDQRWQEGAVGREEGVASGWNPKGAEAQDAAADRPGD